MAGIAVTLDYGVSHFQENAISGCELQNKRATTKK